MNLLVSNSPMKNAARTATLLCIFWLCFARAPGAKAHADVVRSEPAANTVLPDSPTQVTIWFTESLESQFADIQVLDGDGRRVDRDDTQLDLGNRRRVWVSLDPLPPGIYTVVWSNVSSIDGHRVRGSYLFSVGVPLEGIDGAAQTQPALQSPLEPLLRWLTLIGIMSVAGGLIFQVVVAGPAIEATVSGERQAELLERLVQRSGRLMAGGLLLFVLASLGHMLLQASISTGSGLRSLLWRPLFNFLSDTGWGQLWLIRMLAALLLGAALSGLRRKAIGMARPALGLAMVASLVAMLVLSLTSHAAATLGIRGGATINDYVHLLAASFWVGGLFHLVSALPILSKVLAGRVRRRCLARIVARFSSLGLASVSLLAVTGLYGAWAQVTQPAALATPYGRTLLLKTGLVLFILALAGTNLLRVQSRLAAEDGAAVRLRALVRGEVAMALLILLATGLLTALEPARQVASRQGLGLSPGGLSLQAAADGYTVDVAVQPGRVGSNRMEVALRDEDGRPLGDVDEVELQLRYLGEEIGRQTAQPVAGPDGQYAAESISLSLPGAWQLVVRGYRLQSPDVRAAFQFQLGGASMSSWAIAPDPNHGRAGLAIQLGLLCLVLAGVGWRLRAREHPIAMATLAASVAGVAVALYLGFSPAPTAGANTVSGDAGASEPTQPPASNPFLADSASVAMGQQVYESHCMVCHGLTGHGDGPRGVNTDAVDIIEHIPLHPSFEYARIVAEHEQRGDLQYSPRPVKDEEIWHLFNYLDALELDQLRAEESFSQARSLAETGEFEQALQWLDQALELSPRFVLALQGRGILSRERGDLEQAIADHSLIISLDPASPHAYYDRAEAYRMAGNLSLAVADLQRYLARAPQASDRAEVEQLIAQLQSTPSQSGATAAPVVTLADLPTGFSQIPVAELGLQVGDPAPLGTVIGQSFVFGHDERFELVWGFTTPLDNAQEQEEFDARLKLADLVAFLSAGLRLGDLQDTAELPAVPGLGQASVAVTAVIEGNGAPVRLEGAAFRQADQGVLLFVMAEAGAPTSVEWRALVKVVAARLGGE